MPALYQSAKEFFAAVDTEKLQSFREDYVKAINHWLAKELDLNILQQNIDLIDSEIARRKNE
jgi:hypothetical protein